MTTTDLWWFGGTVVYVALFWVAALRWVAYLERRDEARG